MKTVATTLLLTSLFFGAPVMAGSGHDHGHSHEPVNQETVETNATKIIISLATKNKIDKSWSAIMASSVEKKIFGGNPEWVVVFVNDKITDVAKQKLYVFLTLGGEYIAVNYTGN